MQTPAEAPSDPPTVLIADNDAEVNELLADVLAMHGFRVESAADGIGALARVEQGGIALLVSDLDMPNLDGEALLSRVARLSSPPPALVVSGYLDPQLEARLRALSVVRGIFKKPFDVFRFATAARAAIAAPPTSAGESG
jgi:CheY-like chemotaxis protein